MSIPGEDIPQTEVVEEVEDVVEEVVEREVEKKEELKQTIEEKLSSDGEEKTFLERETGSRSFVKRVSTPVDW